MCADCFDFEINEFITFADYEKFKNELGSKKLKYLKNVPDDWGIFKYKIFGFKFGGNFKRGFDVYECETCHTKWKLSEPDYAWRGYFLKVN
jgi:hypothetical protein